MSITSQASLPLVFTNIKGLVLMCYNPVDSLMADEAGFILMYSVYGSVVV